MNETVTNALNEQIKYEFGSAYTYLAMAAWCDLGSYPGFAHWMRMQAQEEINHGMRLFDYLNDRGAMVKLQEVKAPQTSYDSLIDVLATTVEQEQIQTGRILGLYKLARDENAIATEVQLQWFVNEQVEEEKTATTLLEQVKRVGSDTAGLLVIDRRLAARTITQ